MVCVVEDIVKVLKEFKKDISGVLGNKLVEVILYGSYARGDYTENSDVDILIIVNRKLTPEEESEISRICLDYLLKYEVVISAVSYPQDLFALNSSFVKEVKRAGVRI